MRVMNSADFDVGFRMLRAIGTVIEGLYGCAGGFILILVGEHGRFWRSANVCAAWDRNRKGRRRTRLIIILCGCIRRLGDRIRGINKWQPGLDAW